MLSIEAIYTHGNLMFEQTLLVFRYCFGKTDGELDLGKRRQLVGDFVIVGGTARGQLHDLHRDGIISEITSWAAHPPA